MKLFRQVARRKNAFEDHNNLRKKIDDLKHEAEIAERDASLDRVAQDFYGELPAAEKEYKAFEKKYLLKVSVIKRPQKYKAKIKLKQIYKRNG